MKVFLSRLGKIIELFFQGKGPATLPILFDYAQKYFSFPSKAMVLYVSAGVGASGLYRCFHQAEELRENGISASVIVQGSPFFSQKLISKFSVFVIQFRVIFDDKMAQFIKEIKRQKKEIIFEVDDLLFDKKYYHQANYFKKVGRLESNAYDQYQKGMGEDILTDEAVKVCIASTEFIAKKLREKQKEVFVSTNKISLKDWYFCQKIIQKQNNLIKIKREKITIGYFSGTKSHDRDFETISMVLTKLLKKFSFLELVLMGPLKISKQLEPFSSQIKLIPFSSRKKYFKELAKIDINLAPLETGNPFCEAKSELKFIEAGAVSKPTVASATETFSKAIQDSYDGFLAQNLQEWTIKIEKLIKNEKLRRTMGKAAQRKVFENYTTFNSKNPIFYQKIKTLAKIF